MLVGLKDDSGCLNPSLAEVPKLKPQLPSQLSSLLKEPICSLGRSFPSVHLIVQNRRRECRQLVTLPSVMLAR